MIPGYMKNLTVAFYLQGLVPHAMPQDGTMSLVRSLLQAFQASPSVGSSLVWLGIIWAGALFAATQVVERREYVLEQ